MIQLSRPERSDGAVSLVELMKRAGKDVEVERTILDAAGHPVRGGTTRWNCRLVRVCPARYDSNSDDLAVESVLLEPIGVRIDGAGGS